MKKIIGLGGKGRTKNNLKKVIKNAEKAERLTKSATKEVNTAIETALKKNPSAPAGERRIIKIGSGTGVGSGTVDVFPLGGTGISDATLSTNGKNSGIRNVSRYVAEGKTIEKGFNPDSTRSKVIARRSNIAGFDMQPSEQRIISQKNAAKSIISRKEARERAAYELGIGRGKGRDYMLREETARLRGDFNRRVHEYKSKKAAERAAKEAEENAAELARLKAEREALKEKLPKANLGTKKAVKEVTEEVAKKGSRFGKGGKIALGTAAVLGTAYGAKKLYDRKKK